jgi:hypothetical protein
VFYKDLEKFVTPFVRKLAKTFQERVQPSGSEQFRFLYFNHMNLALKTVHTHTHTYTYTHPHTN